MLVIPVRPPNYFRNKNLVLISNVSLPRLSVNSFMSCYPSQGLNFESRFALQFLPDKIFPVTVKILVRVLPLDMVLRNNNMDIFNWNWVESYLQLYCYNCSLNNFRTVKVFTLKNIISSFKDFKQKKTLLNQHYRKFLLNNQIIIPKFSCLRFFWE